MKTIHCAGMCLVRIGSFCMIFMTFMFSLSGCDILFPPASTTTTTSPSTTTTTTTIAQLVPMVVIPGGSFQMGTPSEDSIYIDDYFDITEDERPVHRVTLSGFYIGKYEMTQAQYETVMGHNPSYFSGTTHPVECVTWYDVVEFCNRLSEREGLQKVYSITNREPPDGYPITGATVSMDLTRNGYRLPTEAEWEYAAKGGDGSPGNYLYAGSDDANAVAWHYGNSYVNWVQTTHPAGSKAPNGLGLYDMSGNIDEWCWDWYAYYGSAAETNPTGPFPGSYRVLRGGSIFHEIHNVRVADRGYGIPSQRSSSHGFRVVRSHF